jgi:hypothetical protein
MPRLHAYKDRPGFYIRTSFADKDSLKGKNRIVTYQVTAAGEKYLKNPGLFKRALRDGSEISHKELRWMQDRGYLTTGGTGAGLIEEATQVKKRGCGCPCVGVFLLLPATLYVTVSILPRAVRNLAQLVRDES